MKGLLAILWCMLLVAAPLAQAQDKGKSPTEAQKKQDKGKAPTEAQKKQQERMKSCNEQAGAKKMEGDDRKKFMSACLKGEEKMKPQKGRMKECNKQASDKKMSGDDRKKFMSTCLKG